MKLALFTPGRKQQEKLLAAALARGGPEVVVLEEGDMRVDCDAYCIIGVKAAYLMRALEAEGLPYLYWDKAYNRDWSRWWRVSVCSHQPTRYFADRKWPLDRAERQGWPARMKPWRTDGDHVLYAGMSLKYNLYQGIGDPTEYAERVVAELRTKTERRIVYRPKPSWHEAEPVDGADFSHSRTKRKGADIYSDLKGAHILVTHGSSACFEAMLDGVPSIVLGDAVLRPISSTSLDDVDRPRLATQPERLQLLAALAYWQWSLEEMARGELWETIRSHMARPICVPT